jgi:acetyl-CoA carboxylase biotin carboxyl carrier protein
MNFKEIKELIKIIDTSNLSEFHIELEDIKLTLKKEITARPANANNGIIDRKEYISNEYNMDNMAVEPSKKEEENLHIIKSPIVGFFYAAPNPETPDFVKVGDKIKVGQVLCIVEAMKLMNEITSDVDGEIVEVLEKNQNPVEFGQPLFKIRKE